MGTATENQSDIHAETSEKRKFIVLLASRQAMHQSLAETFRQYFSSYDVILADGRERLTISSAGLVLVLLSARTGLDRDAQQLIGAIRHQAPGLPIGLLLEDNSDLGGMATSGVVQGILPLSLPLDVLIAIASLLLAGGYYLPADRSRTSPSISPAIRWQNSENTGPISRSEESVTAEPAALTNREEQILQYVSEGFQNKLIANRMALSEHTVKAHVHKVIAKLGVSNRTQAAAAFLRRKGSSGHAGEQARFEARQP